MARPRPEPCGLVVKNGSKILSLSSAGTPGPSSATSTTTVGVGGWRVRRTPDPASIAPSAAVIAMRPVPSSASNALISRFVNTWQS